MIDKEINSSSPNKMATFFQSDIEKGCDIVQDFLCSTCEENKLAESADYFCKSCVRFYCRKCIHLHWQLFTKHSTHGRGDIKKWPVAKKVEDFLLKCDVHTEENLAMLCKDHSHLCCNNYAFLYHRQCKTVLLLSELVNKSSTNLNQVSVLIKTTLAELKKLQDNTEASILSVQSSYHEQLQEIQETREKIITALNILEKKTLDKMKVTLEKLKASLKSDVDKCANLQDELKQLGHAIQEIGDTSKQETYLIASIKFQDKIQLFDKYRQNFAKASITYKPYSEIVQYLSEMSGLGEIEHGTKKSTVHGNPDEIIKLNIKSKNDVHLNNSNFFDIRGICVLLNGQVLIAASPTYEVKLLNQQYHLVSHCSVSDEPSGICQITPREVAVAVGSAIQFFKVNCCKLVTDRKLQLQHACKSIAYHQRDLFVTSDTALFKYTLNGELVSKLHEVETKMRYYFPPTPALSCAMSPTGDKLYITDLYHNKLLTLAMDGTVLATFKDPEFECPMCVHVTPAGQVLVCGKDSDTILQVDRSGSRKLTTLLTKRDGLMRPLSVCYNSNTDSIIVGQQFGTRFLVYKVQ